jgi:hypothetical protein
MAASAAGLLAGAMVGMLHAAVAVDADHPVQPHFKLPHHSATVNAGLANGARGLDPNGSQAP